jgi:copper chaperone NosL
VKRGLAVLVAGVLIGCAAGPPPPAQLDPRNDNCAFCRMAVSDQRFAAQLVAPSEEAKFFDDIGCLLEHLSASPPSRGAVAFVADHRTKEWVAAASAVFTRNAALDTPMNSHLVAHASDESRRQDPAVAGGVGVAAAELFGRAGPPEGR